MILQGLLANPLIGINNSFRVSASPLCSKFLPMETIQRYYGKHNKKYLYKDGVKLNNIYYYPRYINN